MADEGLAHAAGVVAQYRSRLEYRRDVEGLVNGDLGGEEAGPRLRGLLARASEADRDAVLRARRRGDVTPAAADDVIFDIEARPLRHGSWCSRRRRFRGRQSQRPD